MNGVDLISEIRQENLNVYRASPDRIREDVGSEAEIAHDYQGRLIYELLQNADDAMGGQVDGDGDRIRFRLTERELLVMNSGRALTEADVRGLTSTGASSKTGADSKGRRASIGNKGMGFKSILEITDKPEVFSSTCAFVLDGDRALPEVSAVLAERGKLAPGQVPTMRFPWEATTTPQAWREAEGDGFNVLFRFPFREGLDRDKIGNLAESLLTLPATTILFLKHLEVVEIEVDLAHRSEKTRWAVRREREVADGWEPTHGLTESGLYQVWIESDGVEDVWCFLLGHEEGLEIGSHRGGLNAHAWEGVDQTEVTVAALVMGGDGDELPYDWRRFHVFLPTAEPSPYPLLINGAFATDLSRQEVRVLAEEHDYNRFLIRSAAEVLTERLLPAVAANAGGIESALGLLARSPERTAVLRNDSPAYELHRAVTAALATKPLIPTGAPSPSVITEVAVPETFRHPSVGARLRNALPPTARAFGFELPIAALCAAPFASILIDHGARALNSSQTASLLSDAAPERTRLEPHPSGKLSVDPVLEILQSLWEIADKDSRDELEAAVRQVALFPVARQEDGTVERIAVGDTETFFPPRALRGNLPLQGLRFMLQDLCWGDLTARERTDVLRSQMPAWTALFQIGEFKFPAVIRVSVLPALALNASPDARAGLANWDTLAAVCQLAGSTPSPDAPLPYGRLGTQRALFNLCRMPVPCTVGDEVTWVPAYRAYFSSAWIGEGSIEAITDSLASIDSDEITPVPVLVDPAEFIARLEQMHGLETLAEDEGPTSDDDEVDVDEDDEQATEVGARDRWLSFLTWLGVNHVMRPIQFHDAEDRGKGWTSTRGLKQPSGWAFESLGSIWDDYTAQLRTSVDADDEPPRDWYFYRLHDLELLSQLCEVAAADATCEIAKALFGHLSHHWRRLERFTSVELAALAAGTQPSRRVDPPKADYKELRTAGPDLWLFRLQRASFCPTAHGPRSPTLTWWPSAEVERRFDRRGSTANMFLPVLYLDPRWPVNDAKKFSQAVDVRGELTPAVFSLRDAAAFVQRIEALYRDRVTNLPADVLRNQINPAYQNLFELLTGNTASANAHADDLSALMQSKLLVHDGHGRYRFDLAKDVLYAARGGLREINGINGELWTFVLEGRPAVAAPLQRLFGARNLEEQLDWHLEPDESALSYEGLGLFRSGLADVAPFLLARLRVERAEEDRAARDAKSLRHFIDNVEPVTSLLASCSLDGHELQSLEERRAFVDRSDRNLGIFVKWGENPWPPDPSEAEALATAITELLGVGYFEPLLALLVAEPPGRDRLLHLAGASGNLAAAREALRLGHGSGDDHATDPMAVDALPEPTQGESLDAGDHARPPVPSVGPEPSTRVRLVELDSLALDGDPIIETGQAPSKKIVTTSQPAHGSPGAARAYGGGTDLDELNRVGMHIACVFEERRMLKKKIAATVFDGKDLRPSDAIFDVSTPAAIGRAAQASRRFNQAMNKLRELGLTTDVPGFDILTLDSSGIDDLGRLIELKSSGVSARTQEMTWNEWKTAGVDELRSHFYLYLVGNLRADLDAPPFVRAIQDPFGELGATERSGEQVKRSVKLEIHTFRRAEFQELTVRNGTSPNR